MRVLRSSLWLMLGILPLLAGTSQAANPHDLMGAAAFGFAGTITARPNGIGSATSNPGGLALIKRFEIGVYYGGYYSQENNFLNRYKRFRKVDTLSLDPYSEEAARYKRDLAGIDDDTTSMEANRFFGVGLAFRGFAVSAFQYDLSETKARVDRVHTALADLSSAESILLNNSALDLRGLSVREFNVSYGYPFFGVNAALTTRYLQGTTYWRDLPLTGTSYSAKQLDDHSRSDHEGSDGAITGDLGILYVGKVLNLGVVARNAWSDSLSNGGRGNYHFDQQYRLGFGFLVTPDLSLSMEGDLLPYRTILTDRRTQNVGASAEVTLGKVFKIRAGLNHDLAPESGSLMFGLGFGVTLKIVHLEVGVLRTEVSEPLHLAFNIRVGL